MIPIEVLQNTFGHASFRGPQQEVIERVMSDAHAMLLAPTGMGKSLCYQVPAMTFAIGGPELVLVLSPLVALMQDQVNSLVAKGIDATFLNSSLDRSARIERQSRLAQGEFRLVYVTPERFRKPEFRETIARRTVRLLAVDEAHCVSQWGHDFRPDYSRLGEIRQSIGNPTTLALTATATREVRDDIMMQLNLDPADVALFHEGIDRPNLELCVETVHSEQEKFASIVRQINDARLFRDGGGAILYFSLISTLRRFSDWMRSRGIDHQTYHGQCSSHHRRRVLRSFIEGDCDTVLATPAFGMGVDKENIRLVMHIETPGSIESYMQEIGRAGRDGLPARCVWTYDQHDLMTQMQFIDWANPDASFYGRVMHELTQNNDRWRGLPLDDLRRHLQRVSPHDHRLDTALAMLDRHGVIAAPTPPDCFDIIGDLPERFSDDNVLNQKKQRDQLRLLSLVKFAAVSNADRHDHLRHYFDLSSESTGVESAAIHDRRNPA